ncbi:MAG TPA: AAA family ATPase, partial [Actinomycetota bacterium]|nr:AAA family ATPase [Actinomycetota bacterium]
MLDRIVAAARDHRGEAVVLHGEAGIGKTALLEYATRAAPGFEVLRTTGNEAERDLPFAALQSLCAPQLTFLDQLPEPQREALGVAFGLTAGDPPDRLLVGLALLSLLSLVAAGRPLLCVVDDTQWLDKESAQACAFVARRIAAEPIAFLFAARRVPSEIKGLREITVLGLGRSASLALLHSVLPDRVDERVRERFIAEAHGNPLALLELPRGLTPSQLAGGYLLPVSVPVRGRLEASFRRRVGGLPADSRRLLVIAAADPTGDPLLVRRAAALLGVDEAAAIAVEAGGLLELAPRVVFRHPLVRSAVYQGASPDERRKVHGALAEATDSAVDPDRRVWHRAQATLHPDDDVAADLEASAGRAQARGGFAAAAAFLERSAELTPDQAKRAARALAAAEAKRQAGALDAALVLANEAERGPLDGFQRAQLEVLRGHVSFASDRGSEAPLLLFRAAQHLEAYDPRRACEIYLDAMTAAVFAGRLAQGCSARDVAEAALAAPRPVPVPRAPDLLLEALARLIAGDPAEGTAVLRRALEAFAGPAVGVEERLRWSWLAGRAAAFIWDYDTWDAFTARQLDVAKEAGALAVLPLALSTRAGMKLFAGQLSEAASLVQQVEAVADATDTRTARYAAVAVAAFRGREHEALALIHSNAKDFESRGEGMGVTLAHWAEAALYNGLARYEDAFAAAEEALADPRELWFSPWATVELIEAASRTGRRQAAQPALERLAEITSA